MAYFFSRDIDRSIYFLSWAFEKWHIVRRARGEKGGKVAPKK